MRIPSGIGGASIGRKTRSSLRSRGGRAIARLDMGGGQKLMGGPVMWERKPLRAPIGNAGPQTETRT
jgi:hypothetical protein